MTFIEEERIKCVVWEYLQLYHTILYILASYGYSESYDDLFWKNTFWRMISLAVPETIAITGTENDDGFCFSLLFKLFILNFVWTSFELLGVLHILRSFQRLLFSTVFTFVFVAVSGEGFLFLNILYFTY